MEYTVIDLDKIALEKGVAYQETPGRAHSRFYTWTREEFLEVLDSLGDTIQSSDAIVLCGGADQWIMGALAAAMYPKLKAYGILGIKPGMETLNLDIVPLSMGQYNPEGGIVFTTEEDGDKLFVGFSCVDPNDPDGDAHRYDRDRLPKVAVPEIRADQHLLLDGYAEYSVFMTLVSAYAGKCATISVLDAEKGGYVCAMSTDPRYALGDVIVERATAKEAEKTC